MDRPPKADDEACGSSPRLEGTGTGDPARPDRPGAGSKFTATSCLGSGRVAKTANTTGVPALIEQLRSYRRWAGRPLSGLLSSTANDRDQHLRASLANFALSPDAGSQADYLYDRLLSASAVELPVIWGILQKRHQGITSGCGNCWMIPRPTRRNAFMQPVPWQTPIPPRSEKLGHRSSVDNRPFLTAAIKNPGDYSPLMETLRPIRQHLLTPLALIFVNTERSESERSFATTILADYASDDPNRLAELLDGRRPEGVCEPLPGRREEGRKGLACSLGRATRKATYSWSDPQLDPSWITPDATLASRIESAQELLAERFAFSRRCVDQSIATAALPPDRATAPCVSAHADGKTVRVAGARTRDGRNWRISSGFTAEEVRQQAERYAVGRGSPDPAQGGCCWARVS